MTQQLDKQCALIRAHLEAGKTISQREAIEQYGCYRLGARIYDLRREGMDILTTTSECVNRYGKKSRFAVYKLGGAA